MVNSANAACALCLLQLAIADMGRMLVLVQAEPNCLQFTSLAYTHAILSNLVIYFSIMLTPFIG